MKLAVPVAFSLPVKFFFSHIKNQIYLILKILFPYYQYALFDAFPCIIFLMQVRKFFHQCVRRQPRDLCPFYFHLNCFVVLFFIWNSFAWFILNTCFSRRFIPSFNQLKHTFLNQCDYAINELISQPLPIYVYLLGKRYLLYLLKK